MFYKVEETDAQVYSGVESNTTPTKSCGFFYTWLCLIITSLLICSLWYGQQSQKSSRITHIPPSTTHTYTLSPLVVLFAHASSSINRHHTKQSLPIHKQVLPT